MRREVAVAVECLHAREAEMGQTWTLVDQCMYTLGRQQLSLRCDARAKTAGRAGVRDGLTCRVKCTQ